MKWKEKSLSRQSLIVVAEPYQQLLKAFRNHDFTSFQNILNKGIQDPDHWFEDPHYGTLLDLACRTPNNNLFVHALLEAGATPNTINPVRKNSPLHLTIEATDLQSFEILLNDSRTDPNFTANTGNSPLHEAAKLQNTEFISKLLDHDKIHINQTNGKGQTALHIAAEQKNETAVVLLIQKGIDLDNIKDAVGNSGREMVLINLPEFKYRVPSKPISKTEIFNAKTVFDMLHKNDIETVMMRAHVRGLDNIFLDNHNGVYTYLQLACHKGFYEVVRILLQKGANVNRTSPINVQTPLMLAGYRGFVDLVQCFIDNEKTSYTAVNGENVLHSIIKGMSVMSEERQANGEMSDHFKCLNLVLSKVPLNMDINGGDVKGNTALHYAAKLGDPNVTLLLLRNGAYFGQQNCAGQPAFADINPKHLESYFNFCLLNNGLPYDDNYEIIFNYNFIAPTKVLKKASLQVTLDIDDSHTDIETLEYKLSEIEPLLYMSRSPDFHQLLKHPTLTSFIYLKWQGVKQYFYFNLIFHVLFWVLLTGYILGDYGMKERPFNDNNPHSNSSWIRRALYEEESTESMSIIFSLMRVMLTIFFVICVGREGFQLAISPVRYICNPGKWLEIALILFALPIILGIKIACQQISAVTILLSWGELILLIARHPASSTNLQMLKTVSWNFFKFLLWYSVFIVAFALSFYMLFQQPKNGEDNFFVTPLVSIFKTVVMSTGEFDAGSIPFDHYPGVSHLLFVVFIFLIGVVLFNLLNGLAVDDTQAIRSDAELFYYVSQVKLVYHFETSVLRYPTTVKSLTAKLRNVCSYIQNSDQFAKQLCRCLPFFPPKINLFADLSTDYKIRVLPNQENRVVVVENKHSGSEIRRDLVEDNICFIERYKNMFNISSVITMDPVIVKAARKIISKRAQDDFYNISHTDSEYDFSRGQNKLLGHRKQLSEINTSLTVLEKGQKALKKTMQYLSDQMERKGITDRYSLREKYKDDDLEVAQWKERHKYPQREEPIESDTSA